MAGRNISLLCAFQSLSQMDAHYGKHQADVLRDNIDAQVFYRPASYDTASRLEEWLGNKSGFAHSKSKHEAGVSEGANEQRIPLMTAQAIKQLDDTEIIGFYRNLPPFRALRLDWHRFPMLRERAAIMPPPIPVLPPAVASAQSRYKPALSESPLPSPWERQGRWPRFSIDPNDFN